MSLFKSIKEGCRLMGIKNLTFIISQKARKKQILKKIEDISREHPYYGYRRITA